MSNFYGILIVWLSAFLGWCANTALNADNITGLLTCGVIILLLAVFTGTVFSVSDLWD